MNHSSNIVKKPWGYEYLAYENEDVAIWILHINKGQSTSMHCHPQKTTGLVVIEGIAEVSFLADKRILSSPDKVMIRRGLFHSTRALTDLVLLEIETPKDKQDLVRLKDKYGRETKAYEDESFEYPKKNDCLWIHEPTGKNSPFVVPFSNCTFQVKEINSTKEILDYKDNDILIFLRGGMTRNITEKSHIVTVPGDVGFADVVKQVALELDGVKENTIVLSINKSTV
jgi:mannose-6-phosphate isomerase-like protein (cupin superfamily)